MIELSALVNIINQSKATKFPRQFISILTEIVPQFALVGSYCIDRNLNFEEVDKIFNYLVAIKDKKDYALIPDWLKKNPLIRILLVLNSKYLAFTPDLFSFVKVYSNSEDAASFLEDPKRSPEEVYLIYFPEMFNLHIRLAKRKGRLRNWGFDFSTYEQITAEAIKTRVNPSKYLDVIERVEVVNKFKFIHKGQSSVSVPDFVNQFFNLIDGASDLEFLINQIIFFILYSPSILDEGIFFINNPDCKIKELAIIIPALKVLQQERILEFFLFPEKILAILLDKIKKNNDSFCCMSENLNDLSRELGDLIVDARLKLVQFDNSMAIAKDILKEVSLSVQLFFILHRQRRNVKFSSQVNNDLSVKLEYNIEINKRNELIKILKRFIQLCEGLVSGDGIFDEYFNQFFDWFKANNNSSSFFKEFFAKLKKYINEKEKLAENLRGQYVEDILSDLLMSKNSTHKIASLLEEQELNLPEARLSKERKKQSAHDYRMKILAEFAKKREEENALTVTTLENSNELNELNFAKKTEEENALTVTTLENSNELNFAKKTVRYSEINHIQEIPAREMNNDPQ